MVTLDTKFTSIVSSCWPKVLFTRRFKKTCKAYQNPKSIETVPSERREFPKTYKFIVFYKRYYISIILLLVGVFERVRVRASGSFKYFSAIDTTSSKRIITMPIHCQINLKIKRQLLKTKQLC